MKEIILAHSELTNTIYALIGKDKIDITEQAIAEVKAIKALEQEPWDDMEREYEKAKALFSKVVKSDDCISRQIISDYVESHIQEINTEYGDLNNHTNRILRMIVDYIENMPSVTPQEPKTDVIDKIRVEIETLNPVDYVSMSSYEGHKGARDMKDDILQIIDKYKEG